MTPSLPRFDRIQRWAPAKKPGNENNRQYHAGDRDPSSFQSTQRNSSAVIINSSPRAIGDSLLVIVIGYPEEMQNFSRLTFNE